MKNCFRTPALLLAALALALLCACGAQADPSPAPGAAQDAYLTDSVPEGNPAPAEPEDSASDGNTYRCTLSVSCSALLAQLAQCDPEKQELVPEDGWLLSPQEASFTDGESVFDVLQRVCRDNAIHMDSAFTPLYHSAYVKGIGNLYEFDAGSLSGWMYSVNGWFPNYGCSRYRLCDGDTVAFVYTCDMGTDVGAGLDG